MKIGVSSTGPNLTDQIDGRFGRCPYFIIVEVEDGKIVSHEAVKNAAAGQGHGAGITSAETVGNKKVEAVVTINMGPRAWDIFEKLGVKIYQGSGTIQGAVEDFIAGKLSPLEKTGGPGMGV